jgi:ring-1,2-phenylacetyl-CoA epoxidase subunit PaaD
VVNALLQTNPHAAAWEAAERVTDPELPMLTLADLGVLRSVHVTAGGVLARITPTYSGCPAMATMRADLDAALRAAGFVDVRIETVLAPPWTSDWISERGRQKLAEAGISPPGTAPAAADGPVPLNLLGARHESPVTCPQCGSSDTELSSRFSSTACRALWRCRSCSEPFEHFKEI